MPQLGTSQRAGWAAQARVIYALVVRDLMLRYGRGNVGFLWVVVEPMILTGGVMVIWHFLTPPKAGLDVIELAFTGYMPLTLWRHLSNSGVFLFRRSTQLLYHRSISLFDIVAGYGVLELIATSAALFAVWGMLNLVGVLGDIQRLDLFLIGWLMMAWIGIAAGALIAVVTEITETADHFVQPLQYLNLPVSGVFFLVDWLPEWGQKLILYHPMVHCYEVFRAGFFGDAVVTHYDIGYFVGCTFTLTFIAVWAVRWIRPRVQLN